jgi:hypothetical protein
LHLRRGTLLPEVMPLAKGYDPEKMLGVQAFTVRGVNVQVVRNFRSLAKYMGMTQPLLLRTLIENYKGGGDAAVERRRGDAKGQRAKDGQRRAKRVRR